MSAPPPHHLAPGEATTPTRREGRTPPPAPSAAYAKRAREIIEDATGMPLPPLGGTVENAPSAGRRPRAGTLPSSFNEARHEGTGVPASVTPPDDGAPRRTSALSPAYRPGLRHTHTTSTADALEIRPRSGSTSEVSNAFASSPFSNAWLSAPGLVSAAPGQGRSPLGFGHGLGGAGPVGGERGDRTEELLDHHVGVPHDDGGLNFSTLDYLGLADTGGGDLPPASISELRNQHRRAIDAHGPASRIRASTVSNVARTYRPSVTQFGIGDDTPDSLLVSALDQVSLYDQLLPAAPLGLFPSPNLLGASSRDGAHNRQRATTIGALDNPLRRAGGSNGPGGFLSSIPQSPLQGDYTSHLFMDTRFGYPPRSRSDRDLTRSRDSSNTRAPRLSISSGTSRTGTPDNAGGAGASTPQVPTRSLWIGNLDVNATSEALLRVFAPYGAIESLRMLPEKTCAFVNFMDKADAVRARDDVLNRLGGHVAELAETAPVRIGFGKIDSAPTGPPTSSVAAAPPGLVFTNGSVTITQPAAGLSASSALGPLGDGSDQSALPTRALWIGSIPSSTSSATLLQIFSPFGPVESARVLTHKSCGFVNFERLDSAISARNALNGRDILGSDVGAIRIGFARVPTKSPVIGGPEAEVTAGSPSKLGEGLNTVRGATAVSTEQQLSAEGGGVENYRSQLVLDLVKQGVHDQVIEKGLAQDGAVSEQQMIMQVLSGGRREEDADVRAAAEVRPPVTYYTMIPVIGDRQNTRRFDVARLRELRKRLDSGNATQEEIDSITRDLLEDSADLASDYIGNTIIQKLFERTAPALRRAMLERIAPHLAMIGIHKNGTWAAQKIIECSTTDEERALVTHNLRPFAPPLMCDSLGNYVCAGTLRFGAPYSDYVYDAMIDRMWDIAQNRFGARCMRTCLESPHTSLYSKKRIATGIILNSIPLATNPNGALLLTWLVEQSNLPGRYGLLANRFAPHVAHLCTHKLASLTVLRIINQTTEVAAAQTLISTIFHSPNDQNLIEILSDASNGSQVIGKILAVSSISADEKPKLLEAVRRVLPSIKASSTPPYRRLLEEVGLPVPAGPTYARPPNNQQTVGGWQQPGAYGVPGNPYGQPFPNPGFPQPLGQALSPLLMPQNMALGPAHALRANSQSPNSNGSPRTPQQRQRGRLSPVSQMMSPGSDPFNPFASPSIDLPYVGPPSGGMRVASGLAAQPMAFEAQPNIGGLGIMPNQAYYPQGGPGMYAGAGFQ